MTIDLTGKRAIVTGASRGLGAAIVARMREAGAEVAAPTKERFDLRTWGIPSAIVSHASRLWPSVDVVVNCAGIQGPTGTDTSRWEEWLRCVQVNLLSAAELSAAAATWMQSTKTPGSIINISGGGACDPRPGYSAYATSKAGLVRFSETIAEECGPYGIRVNCVAPGNMGTMGGNGVRYHAIEKNAAECVCWLASDASRPITGKLISAVYDPWPELERNLAKGPDMYTLRRIVP